MVEAVTSNPGHITVANTCLDTTDSQAVSQGQSHVGLKIETVNNSVELLRVYGKLMNV
jgi:hypothetical protein